MKYLFTLIFFILVSCDNSIILVYPDSDDFGELNNYKPLTADIIDLLEGVYKSETTNRQLGDSIVLLSVRNKLLILTAQSPDFLILEGGVADSGIVFLGYGRDYETNSISRNRVFIPMENGAYDLLNGIKSSQIKIIINTLTGNNNNKNNSNFVVNYNYYRDINKKGNFNVIAHRAGGRNSDLLPHSENSLGMIKFAEFLGANGIEIDIRLTKDKIPVLFHDDFLSKRLVDGDLLIGNIESYYLSHLNSFCKLKSGELIPTLEEALNTVIDSTNLSLVWLDIKHVQVVEPIIPMIIKYQEIAKSKKRDLRIIFGITSEKVMQKFISFSGYYDIESLNELSIEEIYQSKSKIWAPQWTLGYQNEIVNDLISKGIISFVWTLDDRKFVKEFLQNASFNGILTNYAPIVAYEYYVSK